MRTLLKPPRALMGLPGRPLGLGWPPAIQLEVLQEVGGFATLGYAQ